MCSDNDNMTILILGYKLTNFLFFISTSFVQVCLFSLLYKRICNPKALGFCCLILILFCLADLMKLFYMYNLFFGILV